MFRLDMFHSQMGWVSFGVFKKFEDAEKTKQNIMRFGNGFYSGAEISQISYIQYIIGFIKMNVDNRF